MGPDNYHAHICVLLQSLTHLRQGLLVFKVHRMSESQLLQSGPFTRLQADAITSRYQNVAIEDDQCSHFRMVVRDSEGRMVWRAWNFETDAGEGVSRYIRQYGILRVSSC